jgi:uracil-DNA glycosylase family 4
MNKKEALKKLNQKIKNCKKCPLWKTRKNAVPGEGSVNAKLIFLGQAPGSEEDNIGKPFVGRAGKFLNQLLKTARINRVKVFITSSVKCFPPKNRKPTRKEIETCLPWLKKQIEIVNPQKFILLGEVAFSTFFPDKKLGDFRGKWTPPTSHPFFKGEKKFFATYHPAAGIRFPRIRRILERDFKKIKIS